MDFKFITSGYIQLHHLAWDLLGKEVLDWSWPKFGRFGMALISQGCTKLLILLIG